MGATNLMSVWAAMNAELKARGLPELRYADARAVYAQALEAAIKEAQSRVAEQIRRAA